LDEVIFSDFGISDTFIRSDLWGTWAFSRGCRFKVVRQYGRSTSGIWSREGKIPSFERRVRPRDRPSDSQFPFREVDDCVVSRMVQLAFSSDLSSWKRLWLKLWDMAWQGQGRSKKVAERAGNKIRALGVFPDSRS